MLLLLLMIFCLPYTSHVLIMPSELFEVMLSDLSYIWHKVGPLMMQVALISSTRCKKVKTICV